MLARARALALFAASLALLPHGPAAAQAPAAVSAFAEGAGEAPNEDDVRLTLTAGGTFAYGNAHTLGVNLASELRLREDAEQLELGLTYLLGMAEAPLTCNDDPMGVGCGGVAGAARTGGFAGTWVENANNLTWRARYDHFFDADNAMFVAHRGRRDPFAGLEVRLGLQLGYSRVLFREENHRLSLDVGIDGTFDLYTDPVRNVNRTSATFSPPPLQGTDARLVPAVRVNVTYLNHLTEALTYDTSLEILWNVVNPGHFRFDWQNHIRSRITGYLELSIDLTLRVDSQPPGQNNPWSENAAILGADGRLRPGQVTGMFDFLSTLNLVGTFDIDGAPAPAAPAPEPVACPECPVCPTCEAAGDAADGGAAGAGEPAPEAEPAAPPT